jgi:membrane protein
MPSDATGREATTPWAMPWAAWKQIVIRTWREAGQDNVGLVAAGVAFYGFLALVPLLGAIVLTYGLVVQPATVIRDMQQLTAVMPTDAAKLVGDQLMNVVHTSDGKKGLGLLLALAVALFGARNGAGGLIAALNIAYEEDEKRGFLKLNLLTLAMTAAAVLAAIVAVVAIGALGHLEKLLDGMPIAAVLGKIVSYLLLLLVGAAGAATLYRFGPSRQSAQWIWLTPGSVFAALFWLLLTVGFGIYVANFGNYNATYGSLGAVVVLLTWLYLSSYILLFGAELNSEIEHQTAADTTGGAPQPLGARGAWVADHVAGANDAQTEDQANTLPPAFSREARPAPPYGRADRSPGFAATYGLAKATQVTGVGKVGIVTTGLATVGLAKLRTRDQARTGAALLAVAAGLAWLRRSRRP